MRPPGRCSRGCRRKSARPAPVYLAGTASRDTSPSTSGTAPPSSLSARGPWQAKQPTVWNSRSPARGSPVGPGASNAPRRASSRSARAAAASARAAASCPVHGSGMRPSGWTSSGAARNASSHSRRSRWLARDRSGPSMRPAGSRSPWHAAQLRSAISTRAAGPDAPSSPEGAEASSARIRRLIPREDRGRRRASAGKTGAPAAVRRDRTDSGGARPRLDVPASTARSP